MGTITLEDLVRVYSNPFAEGAEKKAWEIEEELGLSDRERVLKFIYEWIGKNPEPVKKKLFVLLILSRILYTRSRELPLQDFDREKNRLDIRRILPFSIEDMKRLSERIREADETVDDVLKRLLELSLRQYLTREKMKIIEGSSKEVRALREDIWNKCFPSFMSPYLYDDNFFYEYHVLIEGETGTGKELAASVILESAPLKIKEVENETIFIEWSPFASINLAGIPRELMYSELFGAAKGAYTGAGVERKGIFGEVDNGYLFIDEIGTLDVSLQPIFLRVIQEGTFKPLGEKVTEGKKVRARIISATNEDLNLKAENGGFRQDLLYRLATSKIKVPALIERVDDIPDIIEGYLRKILGPIYDFTFKDIVMEKLKETRFRDYHWPGNVRELLSIVIPILSNENVELEKGEEHDITLMELVRSEKPLREVENKYVNMAYDYHKAKGTSNVKIAEKLGIKVDTMKKKLEG